MDKRLCIMCNEASVLPNTQENPTEPPICAACTSAHARMVKFPRYGETSQSKYLDIWMARIRRWERASLEMAVSYAKEKWKDT